MFEMETSVLISEDKIKKRVGELAQALNQKFKEEKVVAIGILKGSFMFYSDLIRALTCKVVCDFCATSCYGNKNRPSTEVKFILDTCLDIQHQNVLLIEDIVDRGLTLYALQSILKNRKPKSLTTVTLISKPKKISYECQIDYVGFEIKESSFLVGYGLDYQENFRHLPHIAEISSFN